MSDFRLARLLRLREEQAKAAKQTWALSERASSQAALQLERARASVRSAREDLALTSQEGSRTGRSIQGVLASHITLDALTMRVESDEARWRTSALKAAECRAEYTSAQRDADALATLKDRWRAEERRRRRRRDERTRDELISAKLAGQPRTDR